MLIIYLLCRANQIRNVIFTPGPLWPFPRKYDSFGTGKSLLRHLDMIQENEQKVTHTHTYQTHIVIYKNHVVLLFITSGIIFGLLAFIFL